MLLTFCIISEFALPIFASEIAIDAENEACRQSYYLMDSHGYAYDGNTREASKIYSELLLKYKNIESDNSIDPKIKARKLQTTRDLMNRINALRCFCKSN